MPEMPQTPEPRHRAKVALSSILMATSVAAVLLSGMRTIGDAMEFERVLPWAVGGFFAGLAVAAVILGMEPRTVKEYLAGLLLGAIFGPVAGIFLAYPAALPTLLAGAAVLVVIALVFRRFSAK